MTLLAAVVGTLGDQARLPEGTELAVALGLEESAAQGSECGRGAGEV